MRAVVIMHAGEVSLGAHRQTVLLDASVQMRDTSQTTNASSDEEDAEALESTAQADEGAHARAESLASSAPGLEEAMRRAARATTTSTVRLAGNRRFTLPESAPIMRQVMGFLGDQARTLLRAGVDRSRICIDPGPGFGKYADENVVIQRATAKMVSMGYPVMCVLFRGKTVCRCCFR